MCGGNSWNYHQQFGSVVGASSLMFSEIKFSIEYTKARAYAYKLFRAVNYAHTNRGWCICWEGVSCTRQWPISGNVIKWSLSTMKGKYFNWTRYTKTHYKSIKNNACCNKNHTNQWYYHRRRWNYCSLPEWEERKFYKINPYSCSLWNMLINLFPSWIRKSFEEFLLTPRKINSIN